MVSPTSTREMRRNERVLKASPLLATPDEAKRAYRGHIESHAGTPHTSERCASGVPNEARVASFSASTVGVNQAKLSQMSHKFGISPRGAPRRSREGGIIPSPSGRGLG